MKIVKYRLNGIDNYGVLDNDEIFKVDGDIFASYTVTDLKVKKDEVKLLPPVNPSKIIGMGINYYDFVKSINMPVPETPYIFHKPVSTIIGPGDPIVLPNSTDVIGFEGELTLVIGKKAKNIPEDKAEQYIYAYTCANDITNKTDFARDSHMGIAKSYDTFCPIGPCMLTDPPGNNFNVRCFLNGEQKQNGFTDDMIFSIPKMVSFISTIMTLLPGDLILTGTPAGPGSLQNGDMVEVSIESIGVLKNPVQL